MSPGVSSPICRCRGRCTSPPSCSPARDWSSSRISSAASWRCSSISITGRYLVDLSGGMQRYLIPGLGIVDVLTELKVVPGAGNHGTLVQGRGRAWVRRFDNVFLRSLAGGLPVLDTQLTRTPDGIVHFAGLKLHGAVDRHHRHRTAPARRPLPVQRAGHAGSLRSLQARARRVDRSSQDRPVARSSGRCVGASGG